VTAVRRNVWSLGTEQDPWHPILLAFATAVRAMQQLPRSDPRSWRYQAAIHGITGVAPPAGAPWNECQHASWYFLPWHRMYLYRFEKIVRSFAGPANGGDVWALPYWDYSSGDPGHALPPAFRFQTLPDGTANPLFVTRRRQSVNNGTPIPDPITDVSAAMAETAFAGTTFGGSPGFGGPRTGFAHQGPAFGVLEAQPHGPIHVWVGGPGGLMRDPNTAAQDPIFWLHHANIDRLWSVWLADGHVNPGSSSWRNFPFSLRDENGAPAQLRPVDVVDTEGQLEYIYDSQQMDSAASEEEASSVPEEPRPVLIGATEEPVDLTARGASVEMGLGPVPEPGAADVAGAARTFLNVADIEGDSNPGVVYGVYLNVSDEASESVRADHLAGVVSFFGIELSTPAGAAEAGQDPHGMRYSFDVTALVDRLRERGEWDPATVRVSLRPIEDGDEQESAAADDAPSIRVGTVSLYQA
jgi:hypothetical protein